MKTLKTVIILTNLLFCGTLYAQQPVPNIAVDITTNAQRYMQGQTATISGQLRKYDPATDTYSALSSTDLAKVQYRVFFPDRTTEITSAVELDRDTGTFSYNAWLLDVQKANVFTFTTEQPNLTLDSDLLVVAGLQQDIIALQSNPDPNDPEGTLTLIEDTQAIIDALNVKIRGLQSRSRVEVQVPFALISFFQPPTVIQSWKGSSYYKATAMNGFLFEVSATPGIVFGNGKSNIYSQFTPVDDESEYLNTTFSSSSTFDQTLVSQNTNLSLPSTRTIASDFLTSQLPAPPLSSSSITKVFTTDLKSKAGSDPENFLGKLSVPVTTLSETTDSFYATVDPSFLPGGRVYTNGTNLKFAVYLTQGSFGAIAQNTISGSISYKNTSNQSVVLDITSSLQITAQMSGTRYLIAGDILLPSGSAYTLKLLSTDAGGHNAQFSAPIYFDQIAPVIQTSFTNHQYLKNPNLDLVFQVQDSSNVLGKLIVNGIETEFRGNFTEYSVPVLLKEGKNTIEIQAEDLAQNKTILTFDDINLDSIPPFLSNIYPIANQEIMGLTAQAKIESNEPLSSLKLNGTTVSLDQDGKKGEIPYNALTYDHHTLNWEATDLAGNITTVQVPIETYENPLNEALVSVVPDPDADGHLLVVGAVGATQPNNTINIKAGFFNSDSTTAASDGSFQMSVRYFDSATLTASTPSNSHSRSATIYFQRITRLSGIVKDTDNRPLANAKISLQGLSTYVFTDQNGVFLFEGSATGNQTLLVDGSNVVDPCQNCAARKFTTVALKLSIGLKQDNVLQRPVFMTPLYQDGSEVTVSATQETTVTNSRAPDAELMIPADAIDADPNHPLKVSMEYTPASATTIAPPEFAMPDQVLSLEPSGTRFKKPVEVTLPNRDELPPKTNVIIMSYDSAKGTWGPDGVGVVDDDGTTLTTKEGMGITHFSQIYAIPSGMKITSLGPQDRPGASTMDGALTTAIQLPSNKVMGIDLAPSLTYKSSWAKPNVVVTNLYDIPRMDITQTLTDERRIFGFQIAEGSAELRHWLSPEKITSKFYTTGLTSDELTFTGIPNKAVVSYGFDLQNFESGIYPYYSHWEATLKHTVLTTIKKKTRKYAFFGPMEEETLSVQDQSFYEIFPQDFGGQLYVQNKKNSEFGRGWKLNGPQRILHPADNRLMLEESGGQISQYSIQNTIDTVLNLNSTEVQLNLGARIQWPYVSSINQNPGSSLNPTPISYDLSSNNILSSGAMRPEGRLNSASGAIVHNWNHSYSCGAFGSQTCHTQRRIEHYFSVPEVGSDFLILPNQFLVLSSSTSAILVKDPALSQPTNTSPMIRLLGRYETPFTSQGGDENPAGASGNILSYCSNVLGVSCSTATYDGWINSYGNLPTKGTGGNTVSTVLLNTPSAMTASIDGKSVTVADSGNNRVIKANLETNTVTIIAGNGQTLQKADEVLATDSSLVNPVDLTYDSLGNLYILTGQGYLRMVDTQGIIHTIGGIPYNDVNAVLADQAPALLTSLLNPSHLVLDEQKALIYVSDTGHNRVIAFDVSRNSSNSSNTGIAYTVAGTGTAGPLGDKGAALNAQLSAPKSLGLDPQGNLYIVDSGNNKVRKVTFEATGQSYLTYQSSAKDNTSLIKNTDGTFVRTYRDGSTTSFNAEGYEVSRQDRQGRTSSFEYDSLKRVIKQTLPTGQYYSYRYTADKLTEVIDPSNRSTLFSYDGNDLQQVTFSDGTHQVFGYDNTGLLLQENNARGKPTSYMYNSYGRLSRVTRADQSVIQVEDTQSKTMANGFTSGSVGTLNSLNSAQATDSVTDGNLVKTEFMRDQNGFISIVKDGVGQYTKIDHDLEGRTLKIYRNFVNSDNWETTNGTFDSTVTFTYNTWGDLISTVDSATNLTKSSTFNAQGDLLTETSPTGVIVTHGYDTAGFGLEVSTSDSVRGVIAQAEYNHPLKLKTQSIDVSGAQSQFTYDSIGNLASVSSLVQGTQTVQTGYTRDSAGNVITLTNANNQTTAYEFDDWNRTVAVGTPKNERTEYQYSLTGKLTQVKDAENNLIQFGYDDLDRVTQKTDQLGKINLYSYDFNSNLTYERDPNGNEKHYTYNSKNQMIQKRLPDNLYGYEYNSAGNLTYASNNVSQLANTYDADQQKVLLTQTSGQGGLSVIPQVSLSYSYDTYGRLETMTDPTGDTVYAYDSLSRPTGVIHPDGQTYSYGFDAGSRITTIVSNGSGFSQMTSLYGFDAQSFLTSIIHKKGGTSGSTVASLAYGRDALGNRTTIQAASGINRTLAYDGDQQLSGLTYSSGGGSGLSNEIFTYSSTYNRSTDDGGSYTYDSVKQRLTEDYRNFYFYDDNGNQIKKQDKTDLNKVTSYSYNSENQMTGFKVFDGSSPDPVKEVKYYYDVLGRRIQKSIVDHIASINSFTRTYAYSGNEILMEYDENFHVLAHYNHSGLRTDDIQGVTITSSGVTAGLATTASSYRYLKDALGSITEIVDENADLVQKYDYSAYGKIIRIFDSIGTDITANPTVKTSFTFTGRESDSESGLYYYRARFYDPTIGRFLQKDPHPGILADPLSIINSYIYTQNNPSMYTDPSGKFIWAIVGLFALLGAAQNLKAALDAKGSFWQIIGSTMVGAANGALNGLAVGSGFWWQAGMGYLGSMLNNSVNQALFKQEVDPGQAFLAGFLGALSGAVAGKMTSLLVGKLDKYITIFGQEVLSSSFAQGLSFVPAIGNFVPSGIPDLQSQGCDVLIYGGQCSAEYK
jgi:RHS repeat-associated protein